jgi:hypothetical protein
MSKKSNLMESFVISFDKFVNEAHINPEGELEDFDFKGDAHIDHADAVNDFIENMTTFFKDNDASNVNIDVNGPFVRLKFDFYNEAYGFIGNLDSGYGELAKLDHSKRDALILGQFSDMNVFFDMVKEKGLYFLRDIENE